MQGFCSFETQTGDALLQIELQYFYWIFEKNSQDVLSVFKVLLPTYRFYWIVTKEIFPCNYFGQMAFPNQTFKKVFTFKKFSRYLNLNLLSSLRVSQRQISRVFVKYIIAHLKIPLKLFSRAVRKYSGVFIMILSQKLSRYLSVDSL